MKQYKESNLWVSEDGSILNKKFSRVINGNNHGGYIMVQVSSKKGYEEVVYAHRMVAMCYIPNPDNKPWINHKNGIKTDNRVENLEWCTPKENIAHAVGMGLYWSGGEIHNSIFGAHKKSYKKSGHKVGSEWSAKTEGGEVVIIRLEEISRFDYEIWKWCCVDKSGWSTSLIACKAIAPKITGGWKRVKNEYYAHDKIIDRTLKMFHEIEWIIDALGRERKIVTKECFDKYELKWSLIKNDYNGGDSVYIANVIRKLGYKIVFRKNIYVYKK